MDCYPSPELPWSIASLLAFPHRNCVGFSTKKYAAGRVEYFPNCDDAVRVCSIIDAPLSHFNFQRHFNPEEYFMIKLCNICDKANVPHHVVDDIVNLLREVKKRTSNSKQVN